MLEHLNIPNANACEIEYLTECPEYGMVDKWIAAPDDNVINRIVITVDMHEEDSDSKSMESACAFCSLITMSEEQAKSRYIFISRCPALLM